MKAMFGASIEDSLLMPLERGLIYIPRFEGGTIGVSDWNSRPIVITTSNDLRPKLSSAVHFETRLQPVRESFAGKGA